MAGLVPAIHESLFLFAFSYSKARPPKEGVDGRDKPDKPGHDGEGVPREDGSHLGTKPA
jgi:hypothetical protein